MAAVCRFPAAVGRVDTRRWLALSARRWRLGFGFFVLTPAHGVSSQGGGISARGHTLADGTAALTISLHVWVAATRSSHSQRGKRRDVSSKRPDRHFSLHRPPRVPLHIPIPCSGARCPHTPPARSRRTHLTTRGRVGVGRGDKRAAIPGSLTLSLLAGALFGPYKGLALVIFTNLCGSSLCFAINTQVGRAIAYRLWPTKVHDTVCRASPDDPDPIPPRRTHGLASRDPFGGGLGLGLGFGLGLGLGSLTLTLALTLTQASLLAK